MAESSVPTVGPRVTRTELLRVANTQALMIQGDAANLGTVLAHALTENSNDQSLTNALEVLRDIRASSNETFHSVACVVLDSILRDRKTVFDCHGVGYSYRGCSTYGLCVSDVSGAYHHTLRVVDMDSNGFRAERDAASAERFTYVRPTEHKCGVMSDPD